MDTMDVAQCDTETSNETIKQKKRKNPFNTQRLKEEKERRQKKRCRLIVRNISYKSTEEILYKHFSQWGTVEEVNILKRSDGKLVGCAFVQFDSVTHATKAILNGNNKELLGRAIFIDWALGKDDYKAKVKDSDAPVEKKPKVEIEEKENEIKSKQDNTHADALEDTNKDKYDSDENSGESDNENSVDEKDEDSDDEKQKFKFDIDNVKKEKHISNDVQEGCTVFIKNVPFDAEDIDLRKVCRKYGPLYYAIINREMVSGHSKGTAFVKFKTKESADLCLKAGPEFTLNGEELEPNPALSREEIHSQNTEKSKLDAGKDSRNLYLSREGLIMAGSKAADGVSAADIAKRNQLEQIKTQVLKNLNRFISRNRLSIHNLPHHYDNEKLKQMAITYTGSRPHECRVMRENKVTPEHPLGKSKGFGFLSFSTHQEALTALRKLNNNPKVFGPQHRPIVAFSIEDRAVHRLKEKRNERAKLNNPTYQSKLEKRKERMQKTTGKQLMSAIPQTDNKRKVQKAIQKLEAARVTKTNKKTQRSKADLVDEQYMGAAAKPGIALHMRSKKKIMEQTYEHSKRIKSEKRKHKQKKIKQTHLAERKADIRPKQGRKVEKDDIQHLVSKYKHMIDGNANSNSHSDAKLLTGKAKKPKRTKWYAE